MFHLMFVVQCKMKILADPFKRSGKATKQPPILKQVPLQNVQSASSPTILKGAAGEERHISLRYRLHAKVSGRRYLVKWTYIHHIFVNNRQI